MNLDRRWSRWVVAVGTAATALGNGCSSRAPSDTTRDGGTATDGGTQVGSDASATGPCSGSAVSCGASPKLYPGPAGSLFCGNGAKGGVLTCSSGEECCLGGALSVTSYAPNECAPSGSACTNGGTGTGMSPGLPLACEQTADCGSGAKCCLQSATLDSACGWPVYRDGGGTACEAAGACTSGDVQVCSSDAECPSGTTCVAGKWQTFEFGLCLATYACTPPPPDSGTSPPDASSSDTTVGACTANGDSCSPGVTECCGGEVCNSAAYKCGCSPAVAQLCNPGIDCACYTQADCCTGVCYEKAFCCNAGLPGASCESGADCCSGVCSPTKFTCY
jgi:hypothetical protein